VGSLEFWNEREARQMLADKVEELRGLGYDGLKQGGNPQEEVEAVGPSGVVYFLEIVIEDAFEPEIEVTVILGEKYGISPEISDGFSIHPGAGG
jgi:hypothetical protein